MKVHSPFLITVYSLPLKRCAVSNK